MTTADQLYDATILAFAGNISLLGRLADPDATATAYSRLCGSVVTVDVSMAGEVVGDFAQEVKACALGQASAAILARHVIGARPEEIRDARDSLREMLRNGGPQPRGRFAELGFLEPVREYKARHASTLLAFDAAVEALDRLGDKGSGAAAGAE
jgi:NifU-like protein involved in Fe-S cluster formation